MQGCDASVIISSPNGDAEKDYTENLSLPGDGFDTVIKAKQAVEASCPGVVSCADILALATRDVISLVTIFQVKIITFYSLNRRVLQEFDFVDIDYVHL